MATLTFEQKLKQKTLYEIGYNYLVDNFHKFKPAQQIKVALDVISIFNKDGSKSNEGKQIIFVVNSGGELPRESAPSSSHHFEILPSQIATDNPGKSEQV